MDKKLNVLLVSSPYYKLISKNLIKGASDVLNNKSVNFDVLSVPGALEIPPAIKFVSSSTNKSNFFDGYIALGCVIRGETYHFEIVANESARSLSNLSVLSLLPIGNGILTVENMEQEILRSDPKKLNKGAGAALACLSLKEIKNKLWVE